MPTPPHPAGWPISHGVGITAKQRPLRGRFRPLLRRLFHRVTRFAKKTPNLGASSPLLLRYSHGVGNRRQSTGSRCRTTRALLADAPNHADDRPLQ